MGRFGLTHGTVDSAISLGGKIRKRGNTWINGVFLLIARCCYVYKGFTTSSFWRDSIVCSVTPVELTAGSLRTVGVVGCGEDSGIGNHDPFQLPFVEWRAPKPHRCWANHGTSVKFSPNFFQPARYQQQKTYNWNSKKHLIFLGVPPWKSWTLCFFGASPPKKTPYPPFGIGPSFGTVGTCSNWVLNSKISFFKSRTKASCCCDRDRSSDVMSPVPPWEMVVLGGEVIPKLYTNTAGCLEVIQPVFYSWKCKCRKKSGSLFFFSQLC